MTKERIAEKAISLLPFKMQLRIRIGPDGCWNWMAGRAGRGYGVVYLDGRHKYTHRVVYEFFRSVIPKGLQIDHLCRNTRCCNPNHLEAVTCSENLLRGTTVNARAAAATTCPKQHPYQGTNLYRDPRGHRQCRECRRIARRKHRLAARRDS